MDHRAYHLQQAAHRAVFLALKRGDLHQQACEICGGTGQAHHDSYYPEKFLNVRWLCTLHHRQWHLENEPIWPTIFEYHPSHQENEVWGHSGGKGRSPRPWFRTARGRWYVCINGKTHNLGPDKSEAIKLFEKLLSEK